MRTRGFDYSVLAEAFDRYAEERYYSEEMKEAEREITFSPAFEARMEKLIRQQKMPFYVVFNTVGKRVAAVVIAVLLGLTVTTFSVKALREPFVRFVTEVFEKFTSIVFVQDEEDAPQDDFVFEKAEPQYIPEGYTSSAVTETSLFYEVRYEREEYEPIRYKQQCVLGTTANADTEDTAYEKVSVGEYEGMLYTNKDRVILMFCDAQYRYTLIVPTALGEDEMIRMAESIA